MSIWDVVTLVEKPVGHSNMSLAEADKLLRSAGLMRGDWDYLKDEHFAKYIHLDMNTIEDVEAFLVKLDKDNEDHTKPGPMRWGCSKAKGIREWLKNSFWLEGTKFRKSLAANRRVMCSCHEVGSYKRRDELPIGHQERYRD